MHNKKTLDEWLSWQEQLMEETILLGLDRVQLVYRRLFPDGVPFLAITVGGTNGKGSTIAFIDSIYRESKYKVGCSTSPHLIKYNERYAIDGEIVNDEVIIKAFEAIEAKREGVSLTYFEFSTLAALIIFSEADVDIAILEVGLGGRLDSVNVVDSDVSVITNIAIDHTDYLGDTRESIGTEKAGIIKPSVPCVVGPQPDEALEVIEAVAQRLQAPTFIYGQHWHVYEERNRLVYQDERGLLDLPLPVLPGAHQIYNAGAALAALRHLDLPETRF